MNGLYANYRLKGSGNHLVDHRDEDNRRVEEDTPEDENEEDRKDDGEGVKD